jgi:hypothetical protein
MSSLNSLKWTITLFIEFVFFSQEGFLRGGELPSMQANGVQTGTRAAEQPTYLEVSPSHHIQILVQSAW